MKLYPEVRLFTFLVIVKVLPTSPYLTLPYTLRCLNSPYLVVPDLKTSVQPVHNGSINQLLCFVDKCLMEYGGNSGEFSSVNRECEFKVYYPNKPIELMFKNISVPRNNTIDISQRHTPINNFKSLGIIRSDDSGKTRYFRNIARRSYNVITFHTTTANVRFSLSFKPLTTGTFFTIIHALNSSVG